MNKPERRLIKDIEIQRIIAVFYKGIESRENIGIQLVRGCGFFLGQSHLCGFPEGGSPRYEIPGTARPFACHRGQFFWPCDAGQGNDDRSIRFGIEYLKLCVRAARTSTQEHATPQ